MLIPDGESVKRLDIADSEWEGPDSDTIGWWRSQMPAKSTTKLKPAPNGVLLDTLSSLLERPECESLAYLLAVLLVRRRVLVDEESLEQELNGAEQDSSYWSLNCTADERTWNVPLVEPEPDQWDALRQQLEELLFTEE